jgi:hypothetical protein
MPIFGVMRAFWVKKWRFLEHFRIKMGVFGSEMGVFRAFWV